LRQEIFVDAAEDVAGRGQPGCQGRYR
jgi:hypothetical protein